MTAHELHEVGRGRDPSPSTEYFGGIDLTNGKTWAKDSISLGSRFGDIHLTLTVNSGPGYAQLVVELSPGEAREFAGALEKAASAAENYRERNA